MNRLMGSALLVGAGGFISLSYEMIWYRTFSVMTMGAAYAFPLLLGAFLLGIAFGSHLARDFCGDDDAFDPAQLRKVGYFVLLGNAVAVSALPSMAYLRSFGFHAGIALLPVILGAGILGAQLPLISHYGVTPDERAGKGVSLLYVANIVGSVAGTLLTGLILFDLFSLPVINFIMFGLGLAMSLGALIASNVRGKGSEAAPSPDSAALARPVLLVVAVGAILTLALPSERIWERIHFADDYTDSAELSHIVETKSGVIFVDQNDRIFGGGAYDGDFNVDPRNSRNHVLRPYAMSLFHPSPKRVLMIGLASGSWATIVANHPEVEEFVIVEINDGYLDLIEQYPTHARLLEDPRVTIVIDDGRRWLNQHPEQKFDFVMANATIFWRSQATSLISVEFLEIVQDHLEPGGVYMWNVTGSKRAMKTAFEVFDHGARFQSTMVAGPDPLDVDWDRFRNTLLRYQIWGQPLLDEANPADVAFVDEALDISDDEKDPEDLFEWTYESREDLLERVGDERAITDDNMGGEWEVPLMAH